MGEGNKLKKYSRNKRTGKDRVLTARLENEDYELFQQHCNDYGLSISEAVEILIKEEIEFRKNKQIQSVKNNDDINNDDEYKINNEVKTINTNVKKKHVPSKRFTSKQYEIDNELPCPICNEWSSYSNFSRHVKEKHNTTTKELFETNMEKVKEMVEAKKQ